VDLNSISTAQVIINLFMLIAGGVVSWYVRISWEMLQELRKDHTEAHAKLTDKVNKIEVLVAGQYITRTEIEEICKALRGTMEAGFNRIFDKLDGKVDKK
jgi:hypothetical protein